MPVTDSILSGYTHDIVIHINNSQRVGLIARTNTYRVQAIPRFAPRLSAGEQSAVDLSWLRSFAVTFERGGGLLKTRDASRERRFAEGMNVIVDREGNLLTTLLPMQTSSLNNQALGLSSNRSIKMFTMSNAARMVVESVGLWTFTGNVGQEQWVATHTNQFGVNATLKPLGTLLHSDVGFVAVENSVTWAYGTTGSNAAARVYLPAFSNTIPAAGASNTYNALAYTQMHQLYNYDRRLWKTNNHRIAYWDAGLSRWSDWIPVGEASRSISNSETFIGRKFFGKPDGLWVFDAGRVYQVEDYSAEADPSNFALMRAYRGALYFNIGRRLIRYTAGGALEEIPWPGGVIRGGHPGMGVLLILGEDDWRGGDFVWGFNPDTGATFPMLAVVETARKKSGTWDHKISLFEPADLGDDAAIMLGPVFMSQLASATHASSVALYRTKEAVWSLRQVHPRSADPGVVNLPEIDCNIPGLPKQLVRIKVFYQMLPGHAIQVYQRKLIPGNRLVRAEMTYTGNSTADDPVLRDGDIRTGKLFAPTDEFRAAAKQPTSGILFMYSRVSGTQGIYWDTDWEYETALNTWVPLTIRSRVHLPLKWNRPGTIGWPELVTWDVPTDWFSSSAGGAGHAANSYHVRKLAAGDGVYTIATEAALALDPRRQEEFTLLGTVTDDTLEEKSIVIDPAVTVNSFRLQLRIHGGATPIRPLVKGIEIEYTIPETDKLQVQFIAVGTDGVKTLEGGVENSAQWQAASLFSMWQSGKPFVTQLPYPLPVAHTRNMVVQIRPPGVIVPVLGYGHSFFGAEYSLELREV